MDRGYAVITEALTSHARGLDELGDELHTAADTARTALTAEALGRAGVEFTAAVAQLVQASQRALASGVTAMTATATGIRRTAAEVEQTEDDNSAAFGGSTGEPFVS